MLPFFAVATLLMPLLVLAFLIVDATFGSFSAACAGCVDEPSAWWKEVSQSLRALNTSLATVALRPGCELECIGIDNRPVLPQTANPVAACSNHARAQGRADSRAPERIPPPAARPGLHPAQAQATTQRQQEPEGLLNVVVQAAASSVAQSMAQGLRNALSRPPGSQQTGGQTSHPVHPVPLPRAAARAMPVAQPVVGTAVPMGRVVR